MLRQISILLALYLLLIIACTSHCMQHQAHPKYRHQCAFPHRRTCIKTETYYILSIYIHARSHLSQCAIERLQRSIPPCVNRAPPFLFYQAETWLSPYIIWWILPKCCGNTQAWIPGSPPPPAFTLPPPTVLLLIFYTSVDNQQFSYTTLALYNLSLKGSQNYETSCLPHDLCKCASVRGARIHTEKESALEWKAPN